MKLSRIILRVIAISVSRAFIPDSALQLKLNEEFALYPANVRSGLITMSFFIGFILLPTIQSRVEQGSRLLKVSIKSDGLPIGAGLGSSAAFSVAASAAVHGMYKVLSAIPPIDSSVQIKMDSDTLRAIDAWAFSGEVLMHGNPSGLDNTTSSFGGLVSFTKDPISGTINFSSLSAPPKMRILLVNTRVPRSTRQLVANVGKRLQRYPQVVRPIFESISQVTTEFLSMVEVLNGENAGINQSSVGNFTDEIVGDYF